MLFYPRDCALSRRDFVLCGHPLCGSPDRTHRRSRSRYESRRKQRLLARKEKIEQRLAAIRKPEERRREKDEKRKAELAGRAVLRHAAKDERFAAELRAILDAEITAASRPRALRIVRRFFFRQVPRVPLRQLGTAKDRGRGAAGFRSRPQRMSAAMDAIFEGLSRGVPGVSAPGNAARIGKLPASADIAAARSLRYDPAKLFLGVIGAAIERTLPASASRRAALKSASAMTATPLRSRAAARARAGRRSSPTCCAIRARCSRSIPRASSRSRPLKSAQASSGSAWLS